MKKLALVSALALGSLLAAPAQAESNLVINATGTATATAHLNFTIKIPKVLFLGIGTGSTTLATGGTLDSLTFDYTSNPADIGGGAAKPGTITNSATGLADGIIPVHVYGNNGAVTLKATNTGDLVSSTLATDIIPIAQINVVGTTALPAPVVNNTTGVSVPITSGTKVTNQYANWTFSYLNANPVAAGIYTGAITYTASMP